MLRITISPYSDHSVNLSRPVCQKMVQICFFTFKYHSIWHQKLNCKWKNLRMDIMDRKTYRKPGIVGVQSKTSPKYRKYRTNKPTQKRFAMDIFCTFLALVHWSSIINHESSMKIWNDRIYHVWSIEEPIILVGLGYMIIDHNWSWIHDDWPQLDMVTW